MLGKSMEWLIRRSIGSKVRWIRNLCRFGVLGISLCWLAAIAIVIDGFVDEDGTTDVGVVLGSRVYESGRPSPSLVARLEKALECYREGRFPLIIVSGGTGREGHDEAKVMRDWLINQGVPDKAIVVDSRGNNTQQTAINAAAWMQEKQFHSATVVSQYFHITRSKFLCGRAGIETVYGSAPWHFDVRDIYSIPREVVAIAAYWSGLKGAANQSGDS